MDRYTLVKDIIQKITNGVFVEIGTHVGDFADFILENSVQSTLYCIDPYTSYNDRVIFIRKFSTDAINDIPNEIDFLYIDGNHRYSYVLKDLIGFYPKVKKNGCIVGDDAVDTDNFTRNENGDVLITWSPGCFGNYGVIKAFNEFCKNNNLNGVIIGNQYKIIM